MIKAKATVKTVCFPPQRLVYFCFYTVLYDYKLHVVSAARELVEFPLKPLRTSRSSHAGGVAETL